jgi:hypothetical protein
MRLEFSFDGGLWGRIQSKIATEKEYESPSERKQQAISQKITDSTIVIPSTNGSDVVIGQERTITRGILSVGKNSNPYLIFTAQCNITEANTVDFRIKNNGTVIMTYSQKMEVGQNVITFMYPVLGLPAGTFALEVCSFVDGVNNCGIIPMFNARQIITGQGLNSQAGWNGVIAVGAVFGKTRITGIDTDVFVKSFDTNKDFEMIEPNISTIFANFSKTKIKGLDTDVLIKGFSSKVGVGQYPYLISATYDENGLHLVFDGTIIDDSTIDDSLVAFEVIETVDGVPVKKEISRPTVVHFNDGTDKTELLFELSASLPLTVKYDKNFGKMHTGTLNNGHLVPSFNATIKEN